VSNALVLNVLETREYTNARPGSDLFFELIMIRAIRLSQEIGHPCWVVNCHGLVLTTVDATPLIPA